MDSNFNVRAYLYPSVNNFLADTKVIEKIKIKHPSFTGVHRH